VANAADLGQAEDLDDQAVALTCLQAVRCWPGGGRADGGA
jgi:hypothetical protein